MKRIKSIIIVTIAVLAVISATLIIINRPIVYRIFFDNIDSGSKEAITAYFTTEYPDFKLEVISNMEYENEVDIIFTYSKLDLIDQNNDLYTFKPENLSLLPSSITKLGNINAINKTIPLQLDHVEFAIRKDILQKITTDETLPELSELLNELKTTASPTFFPILIAGEDDTALMDIISLLTISFSGKKGLDQLFENILNQNKKFDDYRSIKLNNKSSIEEILNILISWRKDSLLHPEWLEFNKDTVLDFAKNDLAGAMIMRLSDHRTYPLEIISNYSAIQFPNNNQKQFATDILCLPLLVSIPVDSKNIELTTSILENLLEKNFQKNLTFSSGLAPVNSSVVPMDIQSSDVRFWAASSNSIGSAIPFITAEDQEFLDFLQSARDYILVNR